MLYQTIYHHLPGERVFLSLEADAIYSISGSQWQKKLGKIPWRQAVPLELTELLQEGENQIQIEVFASPRNMLGPLQPERTGKCCGQILALSGQKGMGGLTSTSLWPFGLKKATLLVR